MALRSPLLLPAFFTCVCAGREVGRWNYVGGGIGDTVTGGLNWGERRGGCCEVSQPSGNGGGHTVGRRTSTHGGVDRLPEACRGVRHCEHQRVGGGEFWNL
jgi:hypothetical protein